MLKMRDRYLPTNCLAALANMSGLFKHLHPYVAQRLVSLFETLANGWSPSLRLWPGGYLYGLDSMSSDKVWFD